MSVEAYIEDNTWEPHFDWTDAERVRHCEGVHMPGGPDSSPFTVARHQAEDQLDRMTRQRDELQDQLDELAGNYGQKVMPQLLHAIALAQDLRAQVVVAYQGMGVDGEARVKGSLAGQLEALLVSIDKQLKGGD